jgi:phage gpG-like protein
MPGSFRILGGDIIPTSVGEIQLQIVAIPDPKDIQLELERIAGQLENMGPPLAASARILAEDTQERFDTETDPDGDPWIPLDEEYLTNKISLGYPEDILHRTGDLERSATQISAYKIVGNSVFFDTSGLPSYGLLHQIGSGDEANIGLASRHRFRAATEPEYSRVEGGSHSNLGVGRGQALPARPFIGMSEKAEEKIWAAFDLWFDEATNIFIGQSGNIQQRLPSGRFGPRIIL